MICEDMFVFIWVSGYISVSSVLKFLLFLVIFNCIFWFILGKNYISVIFVIGNLLVWVIYVCIFVFIMFIIWRNLI